MGYTQVYHGLGGVPARFTDPSPGRYVPMGDLDRLIAECEASTTPHAHRTTDPGPLQDNRPTTCCDCLCPITQPPRSVRHRCDACAKAHDRAYNRQWKARRTWKRRRGSQ